MAPGCRLYLLQVTAASVGYSRYNEIGAAVCFFLIGDALPIIGRMISMRVVDSDIYETLLAGPWKTSL